MSSFGEDGDMVALDDMRGALDSFNARRGSGHTGLGV